MMVVASICGRSTMAETDTMRPSRTSISGRRCGSNLPDQPWPKVSSVNGYGSGYRKTQNLNIEMIQSGGLPYPLHSLLTIGSCTSVTHIFSLTPQWARKLLMTALVSLLLLLALKVDYFLWTVYWIALILVSVSTILSVLFVS